MGWAEMAGKIFINYRRGDDPGHTGRLFDRLQDVFPPQQLFLDVDNIAPGLDFVRVLNERIAECDVVLAVIGKNWIDARDAAGSRRLDDPDDFVRIEIASALNQGKRVIPVLVGEAQMPRLEELPEALQPLARRNAVRLTHERFRADTQGLIKALQQSLEEIEDQRRRQAEAARIAEAEAARRRQEAEAARRAEDEERKKKAESEARERAMTERRQQEAAARQRTETERAFATAKRAGTALALDGFLAVYADSAFADEARKLKAALLAREAAYQRISASGDAAVLRSFIATYNKGADVDQARARLRRLEPRQMWRPTRPAVIVSGGLTLLTIAVVAMVWVNHQPAPNQQSLAVPTRAPSDAPPAAVPAAIPAAPAVTAPRPDELTWMLLKDTTDDAALKRFIAQYPDSPLRKDAEGRIAALVATRAAQPSPPSPEQVAWNLVKDSKDPDQLRRFIEQFPDGAQRPDAEKRLASLAAEAQKAAAASAPDPHELARSLQFELKRVGCFGGTVNGEFDDATKTAWRNFSKLTSLGLPDEVSPAAIKAVRGIDKRVCPLVCRTGEHADGELCVANPPPPPKPAATEIAPARPAPAPAPPRTSGKCFAFQGRQFCE